MTVAIPSVRNSLRNVILGPRRVVTWVANYHCHPERPPAPDTVSKAKARRPPNIPETFPHISAYHGSAIIHVLWLNISCAAYRNKAVAKTSHLGGTSKSSGGLHQGIVQPLPISLLAVCTSRWPLESSSLSIWILTTPSKNRVAYKPPLFLTAALHIRTAPQVIIILDCHLDGENLFSKRFEGASNTMYGIYWIDNQ
jgi:hypothetical protein